MKWEFLFVDGGSICGEIIIWFWLIKLKLHMPYNKAATLFLWKKLYNTGIILFLQSFVKLSHVTFGTNVYFGTKLELQFQFFSMIIMSSRFFLDSWINLDCYFLVDIINFIQGSCWYFYFLLVFQRRSDILLLFSSIISRVWCRVVR